jgi:hypothetical protein
VPDRPDPSSSESPAFDEGGSADASPAPAGDDELIESERQPAEPYQFQDGDGQIAAGLLDAAAGSLTRMTDGWSAVKRAAVEAGMPANIGLVEEAALVMGYRLRMALGTEEAACRLAPMTPAGEHSWPPPIESVSADVVSLWADAAGFVSHRAAVARLEDLLFERKDGNRGTRARAAISAYLDYADVAPTELEKTEVLLRAWDLTLRVRASDLRALCWQQMAARARTLIDSGQYLPGLLIPLLKALARDLLIPKGEPAPDDTVDVDSLLREAMGLYQDGYQVSHVAAIIRSRQPDLEMLETVNRQEVEAYLAQSESGPLLLRQTRLTEAIEVAKRRGLHDMADEATAALQRIDPSHLGMQRFSNSVEVPRGPVEEWLLGFVRSGDWRDGIRYLLTTDPPTGSLQTLREMERGLRSASLLTRLMGVQLLSHDGLPSFSPSNDEEREAYEVANVARIQAENQGRLLAVGLRRFGERYGIPSEEQLTEVLSYGGSTDLRLASSLARAFRHWWNEDYEAAAAVAYPLVEAAVRSLLRELDEGIYRLQKASDPGQYPGLWTMLEALEEIAFDESWSYFIKWLLLGPPTGINLRNDLAHGFIHDPGAIYSLLVLRAAALLVPLTPPGPNGDPIDDDDMRTLRLTDEPAQDAGSRRAREEIEALLNRPVTHPQRWPTSPPLWEQAGGLVAGTLRLAARFIDTVTGRR